MGSNTAGGSSDNELKVNAVTRARIALGDAFRINLEWHRRQANSSLEFRFASETSSTIDGAS